jgi:protein TonB
MSSPAPSNSLPSSGYTTLHLLHADTDATSFGARKSRFGGAFGTSIATHVAFFLLFYILATLPTSPVVDTPERPFDPNQLVWLDMKGPGGGGGGGGNQSKEPPRKLETKGPDKLAVAVEKPPPPTPPKEITPPPPEPPKMAMNIPVKPVDSGLTSIPGAVNAPSAPTTSQGAGTGGGAGTGRGTGSGPGDGSGLGPGSGGGTGGGVYQVGNGVLSPQVLYEAKPQYTPEAMRAKIQGTVLVSAVVMPDGTAGDIRIQRSLDAVFGLDQEAVKAVRLWRFRPGTRFGQPVPVLVTIEVSFNLR